MFNKNRKVVFIVILVVIFLVSIIFIFFGKVLLDVLRIFRVLFVELIVIIIFDF